MGDRAASMTALARAAASARRRPYWSRRRSSAVVRGERPAAQDEGGEEGVGLWAALSEPIATAQRFSVAFLAGEDGEVRRALFTRWF
jgi:hypothetical protein